MPYSEVMPLLVTGKYSIKLLDDKNPDGGFLLFKLSQKAIEEQLAKLPQPRPSSAFTTGAQLDNFNMFAMSGKRYRLKDLKGKVVVLNFWFIDCPPCRAEMPDLNELVDSYKGREDVVFLGVALDKGVDLNRFLKQTPFNYTIIDDGRSIAQQYNVTSYPTHVVVDKEGKIIFHTSGLAMNTVDWVRRSIKGALAE
jgi:peroxiredoxin